MQKTMSFTPIKAEAPHIASCPSCNHWLWKIGPDTGFFGTAPLEKAMQYLASDGDTIQFGARKLPLEYTEYNAKLLKGECPHCAEAYWFITAAYPEVPVHNATPPSVSFLCDEFHINITDQVAGTFTGDRGVAPGWVLLRQHAQWQDREIRVDVHMVGPFPSGEALIGPNGVSGCGPGTADEARQNIWADAADLVRAITPHAVEHIRAAN